MVLALFENRGCQHYDQERERLHAKQIGREILIKKRSGLGYANCCRNADRNIESNRGVDEGIDNLR